MASFKRNIIASYASQIYVTLIGILMVPVYFRYMGAEAYGLVAFFAMLQAWFQLLDFGLTPTMARETARFRGGAIDVMQLRRLLRAMEGVFIGVAMASTAIVVAASDSIADSWLKVQQLPLAEVRHTIMLMGAIVALRWICGLYRGAVIGFERLVWLGSFNIAIATARFVLVIPFFIYVGTSPTEFFVYQLGLAVVEALVLVTEVYRLLPDAATVRGTPWQWEPLRGVLRFSLSVGLTAAVWVVIVQTDKLVLSRLLPLGEFAYFTLAVLAASGISTIASPINAALMPRLSRLHAEDNEAEFARIYRNATQLVAVISIPATLMLTLFPEQVLWAWTGDAGIVGHAAPTLILYSLGNGILSMGAFPYFLQFAKGNMKMHLLGAALFMVFLLPALVWVTWRYGVTGAGLAWLGANSAYFLLWVPMVHRRFLKGLHIKWLTQDIGAIALTTVTSAVLLQRMVVWSHSRLLVVMELAIVSVALMAAAAAGSSLVRQTVSGKWRRKRKRMWFAASDIGN
jgi:O-antigen/teichoic acid export membrane protein